MSKRKTAYLRVPWLVLLLILAVFTLDAMLEASNWLTTSKSYSSAAHQQTDPMRNIRFTVYDAGIYPHEIEVEAGRLSMVFDDRTGKHSGFVVERITGNHAEQVGQIEATNAHWRTRFQLRVVPGSYRVFASDSPQFQSTLIVKP